MATAGISVMESETSTSEQRLLNALKYLLELGLDLNATNDAGNTALHAAAYTGFNVIAQFLVEHGAVVNVWNNRGETPLKIADGVEVNLMFYSQPKTAALLRQLGGTL